MTLLGLLGQEMTVLRQTPGGFNNLNQAVTSDAEGNPVETENEVGPYRCRLEPVSIAELPAGSTLQESVHYLFLFPDTPLDGSDRVRVEGKTYEVIGPPRAQPGLAGDPHHLVATLRLLEV